VAQADFAGEASDDVFELSAREAQRVLEAHRASAPPPGERLVEYTRGMMCNVEGPVTDISYPGWCISDYGLSDPPDCGGDEPLDPLWRRERDSAADPWRWWTLVSGWACPADVADPAPVVAAEDFRRLPIGEPTLHLEPDRGWVLVNKELVVRSDAGERALRTDLLGVPVEVVATPVEYTWDFHDGSAPLTTRSPGRPYPEHDVSHVYRRTGAGQVTLTVTWTGRYRPVGQTTWRDVDGTARTSATSAPFDVVERRAHLVADLCETDVAPAC